MASFLCLVENCATNGGGFGGWGMEQKGKEQGGSRELPTCKKANPNFTSVHSARLK